MDWYAKTTGKFTYLNDWVGSNFPDYNFKPFFEGKFDPLTKKETAFLKLFTELFKEKSGGFYVISSVKNDYETLAHEIVHALFYLFPGYRNEAVQCLKHFKLNGLRKSLLKSAGYHKDVLNDEINAFVLTGLDEEDKDAIHKSTLVKLRRKLSKIFKCYFGLSIMNSKDLKILAKRIHYLKFKPLST